MSKGKVYFYTLGCRVNQYETDAARELFISAGYEIVCDHGDADICIVNTCTVTGEADRKSRQHLRGLARLNPGALIVAMGCASEMADGEVEADIVLGTRDKKELLNRVEEFLSQRKAYSHKSTHTRPELSKTDVYHDFGTVVSPEGSRAFLKIQDGCNNFCTYCIIPFARGRVASRSRESIREEVEKLAAAGFHEVIVSGIEVCSYGADRGEGIEAFLGVLQDVAVIPGIERIRLGSLEPSSLSEEFIEGLGKIRQMCPHFHLSLQSGSDTVLKRMNRKYDTALYMEKVELLRKQFPTMKLTTDIICGFPGETDEEFDETYEFVRKCGIDKVHVFPYSIRKGTRAASMKQVDGVAKKKRTEKLRKLSDEQELLFAKAQLGKRHEVLVEQYLDYGNGDRYGTGYTREYVKAFFKVEWKEPEVGSIVEVEALEPYSLSLLCKLL